MASSQRGPRNHCLTRLTIDAVAHGLDALSTPERDAILSELADGEHHQGPEDARAKMRRYRTRQHLATVVGKGHGGYKGL